MNDITYCPNCGADLTAITELGTIEYRLSVTYVELWRSQLLPNGLIDHNNEYLNDDNVSEITFLEARCTACGASLPGVRYLT